MDRSLLSIRKSRVVHAFGWLGVASFALFPVGGMLFFLIIGIREQLLADPSFLRFLGVGLPLLALFCLSGVIFFIPYATAYHLTIDLTHQRWTVERRFGSWQEVVTGSTEAFHSVYLFEDSEFGRVAQLRWKDKRQGFVTLIRGDKPWALAQDVAQVMATTFNLPLVVR